VGLSYIPHLPFFFGHICNEKIGGNVGSATYSGNLELYATRTCRPLSDIRVTIIALQHRDDDSIHTVASDTLQGTENTP